MFFPPKVFLHRRAERGQQIVSVHDGVDTGVETESEDDQIGQAINRRCPRHTDNNHVMEHMQKGDLTLLFSKHEKHCIEEVDNTQPPVNAEEEEEVIL